MVWGYRPCGAICTALSGGQLPVKSGGGTAAGRGAWPSIQVLDLSCTPFGGPPLDSIISRPQLVFIAKYFSYETCRPFGWVPKRNGRIVACFDLLYDSFGESDFGASG
jgi:hypothetical protein